MLEQLSGDAGREALEKARASWLQCILLLISLTFFFVILLLLHCSKILLLPPLPTIQIPSDTVISYIALWTP